MSDGAVKQTIKRGVGRQIFSFFLAAAIIPMAFTAWLASHEFNRGLEAESSRALKGSAKEYGVEILTRLELATQKAKSFAQRPGLLEHLL